MPKNLQRRRKFAALKASKHPSQFRIGEVARLELSAAETPAAGEKPRVRTFSMTAYTGGAMRLLGFYWPVVVDLSGVQVKTQTRPILFGHDTSRIVGHSESIEVSSQRIKVAGKISGIGEDVALVTGTADNGFPWQASIGAEALQMEFVDRGNTVKVNGKNFDGPVYVSRKTALKEFSFVPLGADDSSSASIAAKNSYPKEPNMGFSAWLKANGWDEATLTANQKVMLTALYEDESPDDDDDIDAPPKKKIKAESNPGYVPTFDAAAHTKQVRDINAAEAKRCAAINAAVAKYGVTTLTLDDAAKTVVPLAAHAIAEGWDADKVELHALRASRPTGPAIHTIGGAPTDSTTIEAALCLAASLPNIEKQFKPETLEAANSKLRGFGLQQLLVMTASANGYISRPGERIHQGNLREVLRAAFPIEAASTLSLPGILSNVANKELLTGYEEGGEEWREISEIKPVNNFHQVTSYRMLDNFEYEEIGPDGKMKHGTVGEETYTRQAKTYAKMFSLTRSDIINDDMGAFSDLRTRLGRGAKKKFLSIFWAAFINNSAFFTTARTNYIEGATTNLGLDGVGLSAGVLACSKMTTPSADGRKRIGASVEPTILLCPPELKTNADTLYKATNIAAVKTSDGNIHGSKYRPVVVPQLSEAAFTGYSATAWYLFGMWLKAMVVSFLNGQQNPTVESADAAFDTLGIDFRGYHDFGADKSEYLAGVKSKGAA